MKTQQSLEANRQQLIASRNELESSLAAVEEGFSQISQKETELNAGLSPARRRPGPAGNAGWEELKAAGEHPGSLKGGDLKPGRQELADGQAQLECCQRLS